MVASNEAHRLLQMRDEVSSFVLCVRAKLHRATPANTNPSMANWDVQTVDRLVQQLCTSHDAVELIA
jgi:hypothetical protein